MRVIVAASADVRLRSSSTRLNSTVFASTLLAVVVGTSVAWAELLPNAVLDQGNWQQAKGLLPPAVLHGFEDGSYKSQIAELPGPLRWGTAFTSASLGNAGKFSVDDAGSLIENATKSYPILLYGTPFPQVDPADKQAAAKVMYNFSYAMMQGDDGERFSTLHWVSPSALEDQVEFQGRLLFLGARSSRPLPNAAGILRKEIIYGVDPEAVRGTVIVEEVYLDPSRWNSLSAYIPELKRMRPLPASDGSESLFGSDLAHDDLYLFSGKVPYFSWRLLGVQDALILTTFPNPKVLRRSTKGYVLDTPSDLLMMGWQNKEWKGKAWWPTNCRLVKRPVWVVEATSKDLKYGYLRQVLWIDKELYVAYYKEAYDRSNQLWRMLASSVSVARTPEGELSVGQPDFILSVDEHQNRATVELPGRAGQPITFGTGLTNEQFTPGNVLRK